MLWYFQRWQPGHSRPALLIVCERNGWRCGDDLFAKQRWQAGGEE